jgi:hypothetical protein
MLQASSISLMPTRLGAAILIKHSAGPAHSSVFEQRVGNRAPRSLDRGILAGRRSGAHHGMAHAEHDAPDIGEVAIDQPGCGDDVADAVDRLAQYIVGHVKRFGNAGSLGQDFEQPVIRNRDDRIDRGGELRQTFFGDLHAARSFKAERLGHYRDREGVELFGERRDDRRGTGTRASAQSRGHEHHVGALENFNDALGVFERGLLSHRRIRTGAESVGDLRADGQLVGDGRSLERLTVRIEDVVFDARRSLLHHARHGVAARAADADHLDPRDGRGILGHLKFHRVFEV